MATRKKPTESMRPTPGGGGVTTTGTPTPAARLTGHTLVQYDLETLGAVFEGLVATLRAPHTPDTSAMFPPGSGADDEVNPQWKQNAQERELGREMASNLGTALYHYGVTPTEWAQWFRDAMARVSSSAGLQTGAGGGGLLPPLAVPARVTDRFGQVRPDGQAHRGVDLAVEEGTEVRAPWAARVERVWEDGESGRAVRLALQRPDGRYPGASTSGDDSGLLVTYAHLSEVLVREGQDVLRGQAVARSGNTGRSSGPHLHVMSELDVDAPFYSLRSWNHREVLDPSGVWGSLEALSGQTEPAPVPAGSVVAGQAYQRQDNQLRSPQPANVVIHGDGAVQIGTGGAGLVRLQNVWPGGTGDAIPPPLPARDGGGGFLPGGFPGLPQPPPGSEEVLRGVGTLAGQLFQLAASPAGLHALGGLASLGVRGLGGLSTLGGAVLEWGGPFLAAIPYAGGFLAGAAELVAPALKTAGPVIGAAADPLAAVFQGPPPLPQGVLPPGVLPPGIVPQFQPGSPLMPGTAGPYVQTNPTAAALQQLGVRLV